MSDRIAELKRMPYEEYLNTLEWGEKRAKALDRAEYRCQVCNSPDGLQVHHRTYENKGEEKPEDLTVLCEKCHSIYHSNYAAGQQTRTIRDALEDVRVRSEYLHQHENTIYGIPTGFGDLDKLLGGLQRSDMIVVASRPSIGKTSLALGIGFQAARRWGKHVVIFSLEMSDEQLVQRLVSAESDIDSQRMRLGNIKSDEWSTFYQAISLLSKTNIFLNDKPAISVLELRAEAHRLHAMSGLDLLIVDYLQLMRGGLSSRNRQQEMSFISRTIKSLAKELDIPIIVTSQLSQQVEVRRDKHPVTADLKEYGSLEADADVILFIYREDVYNPDTEYPNIAEIIIGKNRNGPIGTFSVYFKKHIMQFVDLGIPKEQPLD